MPLDRRPPRIIPVLDVMNGQVVHAIGGQRDKYRPVVSKLTASTEPEEVARALLAATGARELYVADLDAISRGGELSLAVRELVGRLEVAVWVDGGIGQTDVLDYPEAENIRPVVGFETCRVPEILLETLLGPSDPSPLAALAAPPLKREGPKTEDASTGEGQRLVSDFLAPPSALGKGAGGVRFEGKSVAFSIDLKDGCLLGDWRAWGLNNDRDAITLARRVIEMRVRTLIVLDLARVGMGTGVGTEPLLRAVREEFPDIDLIAGGGVRSWADVDRLSEAGATGVLVASALHDGTLSEWPGASEQDCEPPEGGETAA